MDYIGYSDKLGGEPVLRGKKHTKYPDPVEDAVYLMSDISDRVPKIEGVPTGVEGLDELFFTVGFKDGQPVKRVLKGIPKYSIINLTGVPDTGKSLIAEQFAITQAALGYPTVFITVESPAEFLVASLKQRAMAMGYQYEENIEDNLIIIDAASNYQLRDDMPTLFSTLAYAIKQYQAVNTVIDSVTGFYEAKEMMARQIVRSVFNFLKKWRQTGLLISQKRSEHDYLSAEAAGGYAVSHIVDGTIVLSKKVISAKYEENMFKVPIGEMIRLIRIDGCRMSGHDTDVHLLEITETGLVRVGPKLKDIRNR